MTMPQPLMRFGSDPNIGIAQDATARMQALRNRLQSMQQQDAGMGNAMTDYYKQHNQQMQQQKAQAEVQPQPVQQTQQYQQPTGQPSGNLGGWIQSALQKLRLGSEYAPGVANMIRHESGGNPQAINKWDSNWKAGHPSMGLMQTIQPTFQRWALPGYNQNVYDPVSNIIAGIRYAQNRYGNDMLRAGGRRNSRGGYIGY